MAGLIGWGAWAGNGHSGTVVWADIIGQRLQARCHGSSQSEGLLEQRGVKVSKEGAKRGAFVLSLSWLLSDPSRGDAAWGQSQLPATVARRDHVRTQGTGWGWGG